MLMLTWYNVIWYDALGQICGGALQIEERSLGVVWLHCWAFIRHNSPSPLSPALSPALSSSSNREVYCIGCHCWAFIRDHSPHRHHYYPQVLLLHTHNSITYCTQTSFSSHVIYVIAVITATIIAIAAIPTINNHESISLCALLMFAVPPCFRFMSPWTNCRLTNWPPLLSNDLSPQQEWKNWQNKGNCFVKCQNKGNIFFVKYYLSVNSNFLLQHLL